jgi:hypothetical protein
MSKVVRTIHVFLFLLAGLAICAHLIIPHDHHLVESVTSQDESCPVSNDKPGHHNGLPIHCHAFNDLASEKAISFLHKWRIQSDDTVFISNYDSVAFELQIPNIPVFNAREPFPDPYLLELSLFRAPPILG